MNGSKNSGAKARRMRRPSERNLQVFEQVRFLGETQAAVAARHGVSQERVSQICLQIDRWWARTHATGEEVDRRRADMLLTRRRLAHLFKRAARELAKESVALVKERTWVEDGQTRKETTSTQQPLNPQWGKLVLQVSKQLARLDAQFGPDDASFPAPVVRVPAAAATWGANTAGTQQEVEDLSDAGSAAELLSQVLGG
jgi:hypothetical protein